METNKTDINHTIRGNQSTEPRHTVELRKMAAGEGSAEQRRLMQSRKQVSRRPHITMPGHRDVTLFFPEITRNTTPFAPPPGIYRMHASKRHTLKTACCTKYPEAGNPLGPPSAAADAEPGDEAIPTPIATAAVAACWMIGREQEAKRHISTSANAR